MRDLALAGSAPARPAPRFLASDAGLERSIDGGRSYTLVGSGPGKLNALQITEVAGQRVGLGRYDLYFGTQDTDLWASSDLGRTWPGRTGAEGFRFQLEGQVERPDVSRITYTACAGCANRISGPLFAGASAWPDPRLGAGSPSLLRRGSYLQEFVPAPGSGAAQNISLTTDFGRRWNPVVVVSQPRQFWNFFSIGGIGADSVAYHPVRDGFSREPLYDTTRAFQRLGLMRLADPLGPSPRLTYPRLDGFTSLGTTPTMFAWYGVLGVDPLNPSHLIAPDGRTGEVRESMDGGDTWRRVSELNELISRDGTLSPGGVFDFSTDYFPLVSVVSFNPERPDLVLVGTRQGGIYFSRDRGATWVRVDGSERVPYITSFHWMSANDVYVSSYGRGLWKLTIELRANFERIFDICPFGHRDCLGIIRFPLDPKDLTAIPLEKFRDAGLPFDSALVVLNGRVLGARAAASALKDVTLTPGSTIVALGKKEAAAVPAVLFKPAKDARFSGLPGVPRVLAKGAVVGFGLTGGKVSAILTADSEVRLPAPGQLETAEHKGADVPPSQGKPYLLLVSRQMPAGFPVLSADDNSLELRGRNFDPALPLEVTIDGEPLKLPANLQQDGSFQLSIKGVWPIGHHQVLVRQRNPDGKEVTLDAATFLVAPADKTGGH